MGEGEDFEDIPDRFISPATSKNYKTGDWRTGERPELNKEKCTNCLRCWIFCPDKAIKVRDRKVVGFDLNFCKGCGICGTECPVDAIQMVKEHD